MKKKLINLFSITTIPKIVFCWFENFKKPCIMAQIFNYNIFKKLTKNKN